MSHRCPHCGTPVPPPDPGGATRGCPSCGRRVAHPQAATLQYPEGTPPLRTPMESSASVPSEWALLPEGTMVGPYRLSRALGQGGMGTVYCAVQAGLERTVAIKILPRHLARDPDFVARFNREARTLAALSHPNIVSVFDLGSDRDQYYFCMEFVDGTSLRHVLRERRLAQDEILALLTQVCDALDYAHGEGVVHRDIKPENLLLDRRGRVKVADFGLARIVRGETPVDPLTRTNTVMGTVEYMAPEQRESSKDVDHRADLYAVGVVLYEMLTGALPVGRWELPSRQVGSDSRLDELVLRCLEHDPRKRFAAAADIGRVVREVREGRSDSTGGDGSGGPASAVGPASYTAGSSAATPALPGERREIVEAVSAALVPDGFSRLSRPLPPGAGLDAVLTRHTPENHYLVALAPWPAHQPVSGSALSSQAGLVRAAALAVLADEPESEHRVMSVVFGGLPDSTSPEFETALKKLVDRTGFHDLTLHSATAVDPRTGRVLHHRSSFAFWGLRGVPEKVRAAAETACTAIARSRRVDLVSRQREGGGGRLSVLERRLLEAGYQRTWWHESRPGADVLARAYQRPSTTESVQLVVLRDAPRGIRVDRRWLQAQSDLLRAAIHIVAPSLRYQEYLITLCVGGAEPLGADVERDMRRVLHPLRIDAVCIQAVAYVPERVAECVLQASHSPHYYGHNQTVSLVRSSLATLPLTETSAAALAVTAVPGRPAASPTEADTGPGTTAVVSTPTGDSAARARGSEPAAVAAAAVPLRSDAPGAPGVPMALAPVPTTPPPPQVHVAPAPLPPIPPGTGIETASFADLLMESLRFSVSHYPILALASFLIELVLLWPAAQLFFGPFHNAFALMVVEALRRKKKPDLADLALGGKRFVAVTLAALAVLAVTGASAFLFLIPALVVGTWLQFTTLLLAETDLGIWAAMKESKRLVNWRGFWPHFWLCFVLISAGLAVTAVTPHAKDFSVLAGALSFGLSVILGPFLSVPFAVAYVGARRAVPLPSESPPGEEPAAAAPAKAGMPAPPALGDPDPRKAYPGPVGSPSPAKPHPRD